MIFLTELLHYYQFCLLVDLGVHEFGAMFKSGGLSGHSQGVVCAVVAALAKDDRHFEETTLNFLKYMFFHGVRVQQVYPTKTLPAKGKRGEGSE
jgi:malonyl CoA-acyl carrier protein transacylase